MDRDRLKQVQQTDLTESKVNEDFVEWLKTKGMTYLLIALIGLVAAVWWINFREGQKKDISAAFFDLDIAIDADSLEKVATDHAGIGSVPELARLTAGERYLRRLQRRNNPDEPLTTAPEEVLDDYRTRAAGYFQQVAEATDGDPKRVLLHINALYGLAAVAESGGDMAAAEGFYSQIKAVAQSRYPVHASQAETRLAELADLMADPGLPERSEVPAPPFVDPLLKDILGENGVDL